MNIKVAAFTVSEKSSYSKAVDLMAPEHCNGASTRENLTLLHANNKSADQTGREFRLPPSLISAFILCFLQSKRGSSVVRHLPLVLEVPGSIPARGEKNFGVQTRFL